MYAKADLDSCQLAMCGMRVESSCSSRLDWRPCVARPSKTKVFDRCGAVLLHFHGAGVNFFAALLQQRPCSSTLAAARVQQGQMACLSSQKCRATLAASGYCEVALALEAPYCVCVKRKTSVQGELRARGSTAASVMVATGLARAFRKGVWFVSGCTSLRCDLGGGVMSCW